MGLTYKSKAQCLPDNCSLVFTNMIDCEVEIIVKYNCFPSIIDINDTIKLFPGTRSVPSYRSFIPSSCSCNSAYIKEIKVFKIGVNVFIPPVPLSSTISLLLNNGTCCDVDYGTYSGCDVSLWMSCP